MTITEGPSNHAVALEKISSCHIAFSIFTISADTSMLNLEKAFQASYSFVQKMTSCKVFRLKTSCYVVYF